LGQFLFADFKALRQMLIVSSL